jgi:hypothetical protein
LGAAAIATGQPRAQAVVGATAAVGVAPETVGTVAGHLAPLLVACVLMLALSLAMGAALGRLARLDRTTATLAMIAGAAAGIVSMAGELGADDRIVAVIQYLRVVLAIALTPLIAVQFFGADGSASSSGETTSMAGTPLHDHAGRRRTDPCADRGVRAVRRRAGPVGAGQPARRVPRDNAGRLAGGRGDRRRRQGKPDLRSLGAGPSHDRDAGRGRSGRAMDSNDVLQAREQYER